MTSPQGAELACGLCYEEITVQGEIDSCNHRFCHPCIARWSEIENSCPFCKQRFKRLRRKRLAPRAVLLAGGGLGPDSELPGVYEDSQDVEERNQRVVFEDPAFQEWIEELSCMVCGGGENDDLLLLCDGCDRACHTYCAGLAGIPEGEWFCEVCALSRGNRPQRSRQPVASRAAARPRGRRRQRIDESEEADSDVLEEALSSSLESSSSEEQGAEEAAAGVTGRPAPRRRRIASSPPAAAAAGERRAGSRRRGRGTTVCGVRGQVSASLDDDLDGFVVPDEDEEWMSSGHRPRNSRRRPVRSSRQEASRGGSAGSGSGREEEEDLDQLPLAARLQRIREREGRLGHWGSSAVNDAPTQAHRDVMALTACWEDLRKGTATFSDLRQPSSNGSGGGMTAAAGQPQRRRLVRAGALAAGGGGSSAGAAAAGRPRAADSGASSGGGGVVDLLSSPGFSGPSPISRHTASPAVSLGEERLAWQAFDAAHQQQQQQQAGQPQQRQRRRSGSGAGTLPAGGADDLDLDMSLAARIRLQIAEARERGARLAPRSQPKSQQQQQQPQRQRLLPGSTTGASPHRTARDMQLMAAAARGSTPRSSGQGRGGGGTASARRGFQIPRMQALDGGSNTPAVGPSPQQQAQYGQQPQQVQQVQQQEGGMSQNPFTRFGLQTGSNSGSTSTALHWRQQGGSGSMGGPLKLEQPQQQPRHYAHQQHSSEQGTAGRHLNRDGGSPRPVYRQPAAPHSLPRHQRTPQHQQGVSPPLWHQQPQQAHSQQLSPLHQQHLPPPQQQQFSLPAGLHGNAQWQEGQSRQPLARGAPGVQPTTNGSRARTKGEQSPIAAESTLPPGTVVLQAAARRAAATPATTAPQQQFQQRTQQPDQQQQPQQQQPQKQRQSLSKHDIVNRIKPLLKQCLAEGQLHRDTYKQANKAAVGLLFQLQRPFTAAEAEQAVQQAVHEVLQGQGSPN